MVLYVARVCVCVHGRASSTLTCRELGFKKILRTGALHVLLFLVCGLADGAFDGGEESFEGEEGSGGGVAGFPRVTCGLHIITNEQPEFVLRVCQTTFMDSHATLIQGRCCFNP